MPTTVRYYPPANRPGQLRNESYESIFSFIQKDVNALYATSETVTVLTADPVTPTVGQVWYRSDLDQLSIFVGGVVKRSSMFT